MSQPIAPSSPISWGTPAGGLALGLSTDGPALVLHLKNVATSTLNVWSHVQAQEIHLDWYRIDLTDSTGATRTLRLSDARERSVPIKVRLSPNQTIDHRVDPRSWATRLVNGEQPLAPGQYQVKAQYEVPSKGDAWSGHLAAGPIPLVIP